jgi:hypothetical protein
MGVRIEGIELFLDSIRPRIFKLNFAVIGTTDRGHHPCYSYKTTQGTTRVVF